ncbi:hypothetical protein GQR58_030621 [Nymphon striatum]|nr:hypothetical protein GQR58_030621 [Nymphon striatum]
MQDVDLVVSCLGITTQKDGLSYQDVDFQANMNLLEEAMSAGVAQFAYVHVLAAHLMPQVSLIAAKAQFVATLQAADIRSTVIAPSGYFSDMAEIFSMAQSGRVWGFGKGDGLLNPIHGEDLAEAVIEAADKGLAWFDVGGPTYDEIARLAFAALNKPPKITYLPDILRRMALGLGRYIMPAASFGPVEFFLSAMEIEMAWRTARPPSLGRIFQRIGKGPLMRAAAFATNVRGFLHPTQNPRRARMRITNQEDLHIGKDVARGRGGGTKRAGLLDHFSQLDRCRSGHEHTCHAEGRQGRQGVRLVSP